MVKYKIQEPISKEEFEEYYLFRWKILRKPLGMSLPSVKDDQENESFHHIIKNENKKIIAVGRMHFINTRVCYERIVILSAVAAKYVCRCKIDI